MNDGLVIYVADAGSVAKGTFHWVSSRDITTSSVDPGDLAQAIVADLRIANRVSLGYECPLFVPTPDDPSSPGRARNGECEDTNESVS